MRRVNQTYTMLNIVVDDYDENLIAKVKNLHPAISIARISATKFSKDSTNLLKFYVYHWLHNDYKTVIFDINNYYNKYKITTKVVA
jgi:hypothetical protein